MLHLAALAAATRRGGGSARVAWLTAVDQMKSGFLATRESAAMTTAAAAIASSSSSSSSFSCSPFSVRSFAARAAPAEGGDDRKAATRNAVLVKALTPQTPTPPPPLSAEDALEAATMAKRYSRAKIAAHRQRQRELSRKLELKLAAVAALPEGPLRAAALEPDLAPFPSSRAVWTDTPPIAGFASGGGGMAGGGGESRDDAGARPVGAGRRRK